MFWILVALIVGFCFGMFGGFCLGNYYCIKYEIFKDKEFVNRLKQKK